MDEQEAPEFNEEEFDGLIDANAELRENNATLHVVIDGLHETIDELNEQRAKDLSKAASPGKCPICGLLPPTAEVAKRHLAYHRFEMNQYRSKGGLKPYSLKQGTGSKKVDRRGAHLAELQSPPVVVKSASSRPATRRTMRKTAEVPEKRTQKKTKHTVLKSIEASADDETALRPTKQSKVVAQPRILVRAKKLRPIKSKKAFATKSVLAKGV